MQVHKAVITACVSLAFAFATAGNARAQGEGTSLGPIAVARHAGAEAIDVSGTAPAGRALSITLVSTPNKDLPDVVISRTVVVPNANGAYATTLSIAPGFMHGSVITVIASPLTGGPAVRATYPIDWPIFSTPLDKDHL
jgi:hypothetical protein